MSLLPAAFADLEPFVGQWAAPTTAGRMSARCTADMPAIQAFYDTMTDRAEAAIAWLDQYSLDALPEDGTRLLALVLALAQAHIAVELHGRPRAPDTPWPISMRIERGLPHLG